MAVKLAPVKSRFSLLGAVVFALLFANIGLTSQLLSHADTPDTVNFILFCATDSCSGSTTALSGDASQVQSWYEGKVGRTFTLGNVSKYVGAHPASYYASTGGNSATPNTYYNIYNELNPSANTIDIVQLGFRSMNDCGVGSEPGHLSVMDPFKGCGTTQPAVMAHELGHNLGLAHTGTNSQTSCSSNSFLRDYTLMDCYYSCNGNALTTCALDGSQAASLYTNAWFVPAAVAPPPTPPVKDYDNNSIIYGGLSGTSASSMASNFINIVNSNNSGNGYHDLQAIYAYHALGVTGGLQPSEYSAFKQKAVLGSAIRSNNTIVVNGKIVATGVWSTGRIKSYQGSNPKTLTIPGAGSYYGNYNSLAFAATHSSLPVLVYFNSQGIMQFGVLTSCGNPVYFTPVTPTSM